MISFCNLLCLLISIITTFGVITLSTGIVYINGFSPREHFFPVNITVHQTYYNVSLPINATIIWFPNDPVDYLIYNNSINYDLDLTDTTACLNICYDYIAYYDKNTELLIICDETSRTIEHKPLYKFCGYSNITQLIFCLIFLFLFLVTIISTPFIIIAYTNRYKRSDYNNLDNP
jgi:hypothetical protein